MTPAETAAILRQFAKCLRADKHLWGASLPGVSAEVVAAVESAIEMIERLEAAEKSDAESLAMYRKARDERDELRAKIAGLVPIGLLHVGGGAGSLAAYPIPLYLAPGAQPAPSISPVALRHVIQWLRNGCDPMKAADELEMLAAATEAKP